MPKRETPFGRLGRPDSGKEQASKKRFSFRAEGTSQEQERRQLEARLAEIEASALYQNVSKLVKLGFRDLTSEDRAILGEASDIRKKLGLEKGGDDQSNIE